MIELIKLWTEQVNRKRALRTMIKDLNFSFQLTMGKKVVTVTIEKGRVHLEESTRSQDLSKRLEGKEELFLSIILGEQKLREVVKRNEISTTFTIRELLLVESLFYLGKPELLNKFATKIY